mmetsp:Transcript_2500/g.4177  ORF Transcript_2500/g.4177 Transcript_2500/m.4177 type:complete len:162 (-) Transcript_2500:25-510(-)
MASPQWAGTFECKGPCGRKRLPASEFSKKMVEKSRKEPNAPLKCKECVEAAAEAERAAATKRRTEAEKASPAPGDGSSASGEQPLLNECANCKKGLPASSFSRAQLTQKGPGKQRCAECLNAADKADREAGESAKAKALAEARAHTARLAATGARFDHFPP